jgi:hypothetical protein
VEGGLANFPSLTVASAIHIHKTLSAKLFPLSLTIHIITIPSQHTTTTPNYPINIIITMSDDNIMAHVNAASIRARTEFPAARQVAEKDLALFSKILLQIRGMHATAPEPMLGREISALERIVKVLEEFITLMTKHMADWDKAHKVQRTRVEHLQFLEEDYAVFVKARERKEGERALAREFLRPEWVEGFVPGAAVARPVESEKEEEEENVVSAPKNRAEKRRMEREAKKAASKKK